MTSANKTYKVPYTNVTAEVLPMPIMPFPGAEYRDLPHRKIPKEYCEKWKALFVPDYLGKPALAFTYEKDGSVAGYHIKPADKKCLIMGDMSSCDMYGSWLHGDPTGKTLVITEGHEDCIVSNMIVGDALFHFTTLKHGSTSVNSFFKSHYDQLMKYQFITLCFDNDSAGKKAVEDFIKLFNVIGRIKVVKLPLKDASDMYLAGRSEELKWAIIKAAIYKPPHIVAIDDITEEVLAKPEYGTPWPWGSFNEITYGFYPGKIYAIGAATSVGKTSFMFQLTSHFGKNGMKGGLFYLEQRPVEVMQRLVGHRIGHNLELPDNPYWDKTRIQAELDILKHEVFLFDPTKGIELQDVINSIYFFVNVHNVKYIVIDNLTILSESRMFEGRKLTENEYCDEVAKQIKKLARELNVSFFIICHLAQDKISKQAYLNTNKLLNNDEAVSAESMNRVTNSSGLSWESGRMPTIENLKYAGTLTKLADYVVVLARDTTSDDDLTFRTINARVVKTRVRKPRTNINFKLVYDHATGQLVELL